MGSISADTVFGLLIPFLGTAAGSACVFFMKRNLQQGVQRALTGFASGVMTAASIWSLLIPAMQQSAVMGSLAFLPAAVGFWIGMITTPKTPKSNRTISIPDKLVKCLDLYMGLCYGLKKDDRIFPYKKEFLYKIMDEGCRRSGVKKIRVHDTRHSHASLLVEMGCSPLLIAERLGHEKVQTTMDIYSHLYPNKQQEVAKQMDQLT